MQKMIIFAAFIMLLAACSDVNIVSSPMTCTKSGNLMGGRAECSGTFDQLNGDKSLSFDMTKVGSDGYVNMKITVTVKSGAVTISFRNGQGRTISEDATASQPLTLEDSVFVDSSEHARIDLDSAHGISMGVQYAAEFTS